MCYQRFRELGENFTRIVDGIRREGIVEILKQHVSDGHDVYVISASIEEWVRPLCEQYKVKATIGTKIEVDNNGMITGKLLSNNCYGQEKVNRLIKLVPVRNAYYLYAYGDSRGDRVFF